jgi:hypothetical protein
MKIHQFLEKYGIRSNPFAVEDAQTDSVFKTGCIDTTYHPVWQKVYGDPAEPSTSIVFGEKGAGKTAMRLQIVEHLARHNQDPPPSGPTSSSTMTSTHSSTGSAASCMAATSGPIAS